MLVMMVQIEVQVCLGMREAAPVKMRSTAVMSLEFELSL